MIKYELKENSVEVRKKDLAKGCAVEDMNADPKIIKSFDSLKSIKQMYMILVLQLVQCVM